MSEDVESPYCPKCGSCGHDGCCPAEACLYPEIKSETVKELKLEVEQLQSQLEACKKERDEFKEVNSQLFATSTRLELQLAEAVKALEFYGDNNKYFKIKSRKPRHLVPNGQSDLIDVEECSVVLKVDAGSTARETIAKIKAQS